MRFTVPRAGATRIDELVAALDRAERPVAETWRRVAEQASREGLARPSYANVRRLVLAERRRRKERADALAEVVTDVGAGRVPDLRRTFARLADADAAQPLEARVSETQGFDG